MKPSNETPTVKEPKKSNVTKQIELFSKLSLQEQEDILSLTTEIHLSHLKAEEEKLAEQVAELKSKQEKLK